MTARLPLRRLAPTLSLVAWLLAGAPAAARDDDRWSVVQQGISLASDRVHVWRDDGIRYFLLEGRCLIEQGIHRIRAAECLVWMAETPANPNEQTVDILARGNVRIEGPGRDEAPLGEQRLTLTTQAKVVLRSPERVNQPRADHPLYAKAVKAIAAAPPARTVPVMPESRFERPLRFDPAVRPAQFSIGGAPDGGSPTLQPPNTLTPAPGAPPAALQPAPNRSGITPGNERQGIAPPIVPVLPTPGSGPRRIRLSQRSSQPFNLDSFRTDSGMQVVVITGGVSLVVEELDTGTIVDVLADRAVVWTSGSFGGQFGAGGFQTDRNQPLEIYLEGNVLLQYGNLRDTAKATTSRLAGKQVYYNVNTNQALILDGTVETFDEKTQIPLLMTANEIRQLTPEKFYGQDASFTTSPYRGTPGYAFTAQDVYLEEVKQTIRNPFTGSEILDPSGQPLVRSRHYATGYSNFLKIEDIPVFYWPYLRANVEDPLGPIEQIQVGNSRNLGFTTAVALDGWQLLGLDYLPIAERSDWLLDVGYHSDRGIAGGTRLNYHGNDLFSLPGRYHGNLLTWWIDDHGEDFLGFGRQGVPPDRQGRGRFRFQHHQDLPSDFTLIAEATYLSDRNFLESFYEAEYDSGKDQETLLYLKQSRDSWAWTALVQPQVRDFLPQNAWLPRLDGYILGASLLQDRLTYFTHSSVGYSHLRPPTQFVLPTDYRLDVGRLDSRHEINLPLSLGPWEVTPFAIAQFTGYSETLNTDGLGRLYGAGGVRTSLPFWKVYPNIESRYFNVNGIAHKVSIDVDYFFARSNRSFQELPFLDQVDDDVSELVRRQNLLRQFGGVTPLTFDPRFFALRKGVTTLPEILDDMHYVRLGLSQRLQTKRGPIHGQRIIDWMTFDAGASVFPEDERDNFDELLGLIDGNFQWNVGDRTTFSASYLLEPYDNRQLYTTMLAFMRPPRTLLTLFFNHYDAEPFRSNLVGIGSSYRFSSKYAGALNAAYDFENDNSVSTSAGFSRIGLDFVTTVAIVYNAGRNDFGFQFEIYPRVQARTQIQRANLQTLPFGVDPSESAAPVATDRLGILSNNFSVN